MSDAEAWKGIVDKLYFNEGKPLNIIAASLQPLFPDLTKKQRYEKARKYVRRQEAKRDKSDTANPPKYTKTWSRDPKTGTENWGGIIEFPADKELTPEDVMRAWKLDVSEWECIGFDLNIWQANAGEGRTMNLYQCKIKVKPVDAKNFTLAAAVEAIKAAEVKRAPAASDTYRDSGLMASLEIVDLHYSKLGSMFEVGEVYNPSVAEERFWKVIDDFIVETKDMELETIKFPIGGDFFNSDGMSGSTTGGTPQDNAMRPQEAFSKGYSLIRAGVEKLATIAPIDVILTVGNHDSFSSFCMAFALSQYFERDERVFIDCQPLMRKYREWGDTGLCYAHGDKDRKRLVRCVMAEARRIIGRTKMFEIHSQHLHEEGADASTGVMIRTVSSVTGIDAWYHQSGYVGARKCAQSFIYDRQDGLKKVLYHPA